MRLVFSMMVAIVLIELAATPNALSAVAPQRLNIVPLRTIQPVAITSHTVTPEDYSALSIRPPWERKDVELKFLVGNDGSVTNVEVSKSSGDSRLDEAALTMAKTRWKFKPATQDGKPFAQWVKEYVVFRNPNYRGGL